MSSLYSGADSKPLSKENTEYLHNLAIRHEINEASIGKKMINRNNFYGHISPEVIRRESNDLTYAPQEIKDRMISDRSVLAKRIFAPKYNHYTSEREAMSILGMTYGTYNHRISKLDNKWRNHRYNLDAEAEKRFLAENT